MIKDEIEYIGELIGKDRLKDAILRLQILLKKSNKLDELIVQSARYNDVIKQIRLGMISLEDGDISKNKIRYGLLDILRDIEDSTETDSVLQTELNGITQKIERPPIQLHFGSGDNIQGDKIINN